MGEGASTESRAEQGREQGGSGHARPIYFFRYDTTNGGRWRRCTSVPDRVTRRHRDNCALCLAIASVTPAPATCQREAHLTVHQVQLSLRRAVATVVVSAGLAAVAVPQAQSPQPIPRFRTGVEGVVVDVSVLDKDRRPVRGLTAADFTVTEDGKPQSITAFTAVDMPDVVQTPSAPWVRDVRLMCGGMTTSLNGAWSWSFSTTRPRCLPRRCN